MMQPLTQFYLLLAVLLFAVWFKRDGIAYASLLVLRIQQWWGKR